MRAGERQVAPDLTGIRRDHLARYRWAARNLVRGSRILDLACGIGYGASILAVAGHRVLAVDNDPEAIAYGQAHYGGTRIAYCVGDANTFKPAPKFDAATCFETIEHLEDPRPLLKSLRNAAPTLLASVPNEEKFPWRNYRFHFRHYTRAQFSALLSECGWEITEWWGQEGPESEVVRGVNGRTVVVMAKRAKAKGKGKKTGEVVVGGVAAEWPERTYDGPIGGTTKVEFTSFATVTVVRPRPPESVAILGLGPSLATYVDFAKRLGTRHRVADEIWGINAVADVICCDRVFHMDDVRIQEIRAKADPSSNIAGMLTWLRKHPGPIYTSRPHPDYPGLVEYPLADVLNSCLNMRYFNSTAAYAVAFAIHIGVKKIMCFGMDFSYAHSHAAEKGRGCVEFWLGVANARGIKLVFPKDTSLLDSREPAKQRFYGYDTVDVEISGLDGAEIVNLKPHENLPTAEEIEARYDHSAHPNSIVAEAQAEDQA